MQPVIYADLRCLQDRDFQHRGIGYHTTALLRARRHSALSAWKAIGLVDPQMPKVPAEFTSLVDDVTSSVNPCSNSALALFIDGSPMTHDTRFSLRFQNHRGILNAAVLYDFIPMDWPGYLPTVATRVEYLSKLARLRKFDLFFPISEYTAWRLSELIGPSRSRVTVTGASVRRSLYETQRKSAAAPSPYERSEPYFVSLGGDDRRKNTEVALKAVKHLNLLYGRRIPLKVIGFYCDAYKFDLLRLAGHAEGAGFLEFYPRIPDHEVVSLHAGAIAAIAPSYIEGFSLPVAEASACGCPVIASTCAAHMELIDQPEALFPPDDGAVLTERLEAVLNDPALRASLVASQAHLGPKFHEDVVGRRFWTTIELVLGKRLESAVIARSTKPRLAFLSPYPPDQSEAASYTAMTMRAGEKLFHSDLYTDAVRPLAEEGGFRDAGKVNLAPLLDGRYNAIISVLGNSHFHTPVFDVFERCGGPCILYDVRLTHIYFNRLGPEKFLEFAANLLGRSVAPEEVNTWLLDRDLPSLFLERVIERASPLMVNTVTQQMLIKRHYRVDAQVITSCPGVSFADQELTISAKQAARERRGIPPDVFVVTSFGTIGRSNGMDTCILAIELLRSWNIPAELYFIGNAEPEKPEADRVARLYGVAEHVHSGTEFADAATYRDFLIASDAAVQLRNYAFGQFSTALSDCISAGLATVTTSDMAQSCDAPEYVAMVPDRFSPLQVAEQLALIWETRAERVSHNDARATYLQTHNFEYYGKRLIEILGVA